MKILHFKSELRFLLKEARIKRNKIGFVPTMGALHPGHISLIERAKSENDLVVCSIFVNPTQFDNPEDLKKYPRTLEQDCFLLQEAACDVVFAPSAQEMYPQLPELSINFGNLETVMEGAFRKGHFNGVGIVVAKLFHIVQPDNAYFGLKDLQQVAVLNRLVRDLDFDLNLIACPTKREIDGLAMSSRNVRLSKEARMIAPNIYKSLNMAKNALLAGKSSSEVKDDILLFYEDLPEFKLEYFEITDFENLQNIVDFRPGKKTALCVVAYLDGVRLIDNLVF